MSIIKLTIPQQTPQRPQSPEDLFRYTPLSTDVSNANLGMLSLPVVVLAVLRVNTAEVADVRVEMPTVKAAVLGFTKII
jgi:hypothetical protein